MCMPIRTHLTYNNDKPWFTGKLRQLCQAKKDAYRKGGKGLYKQDKYTGKSDQSGKEEIFWKTKDSVHFQRVSISVERSERDHHLQDTIPQHLNNDTIPQI